jgi:hypothetical protein
MLLFLQKKCTFAKNNTNMKTEKRKVRFHSSKDLEINHLIVIQESKYLNIALVLFLIGQLGFLFSNPQLAESCNIHRRLSLFAAHVLTWSGEIILLYNLMRGMIVLKKPFRKLFILALTGLSVVHVVMGLANLMGNVEISGNFSIPLYFVCMIPYMILGYKINHAYYGNLAIMGTFMVLTALANVSYLMVQEATEGNNSIIFDIICIIFATLYIIILYNRLIGREHVEDISCLTSYQREDTDDSINKIEIVEIDKDEIDISYVISPETRKRMNCAVALFILAQILFFLCAPQLSTFLGISRTTFACISHFLKGISEAYLVYCLMVGMAKTKHPFHNLFIAAIAGILIFNLSISFLTFLAHFGVHNILRSAFILLLIIYIIPYTILGLLLFQRYYGLISYLGIGMMLFVFATLLIEGFLLSEASLLYNLILMVVSIIYIVFLRKTLIGKDTYLENK